MLIGITGLIGSGKSTASQLFKKYGAFIISADQIGKEVVESNKLVLKKLAKTFGEGILTKTGQLRRRKLGQLAFVNTESRNKLNNIVHPYLLKELERQSKIAIKEYEIVVIDAALLIFWDWHKKVDLTILIHAGKEIRLRRVLAKGLTKIEFEKRTKSQLNYSELRKKSDKVIMNNKTVETLESKVAQIVKKSLEKG